MAVASVSVVQLSEFGTVLAPSKIGTAEVTRSTATTRPAEEDQEQQRKRNPRKLNLTG
jgi:hypothetical protein